MLKPVLGLGANDPKPDPVTGLGDVARFPKGDLEELAKAESPEDANADEEVCRFSSAAASGSGICCAIAGDFDVAKLPKGDTVEVLANPEDPQAGNSGQQQQVTHYLLHSRTQSIPWC